jgi:hypothetical protein
MSTLSFYPRLRRILKAFPKTLTRWSSTPTPSLLPARAPPKRPPTTPTVTRPPSNDVIPSPPRLLFSSPTSSPLPLSHPAPLPRSTTPTVGRRRSERWLVERRSPRRRREEERMASLDTPIPRPARLFPATSPPPSPLLLSISIKPPRPPILPPLFSPPLKQHATSRLRLLLLTSRFLPAPSTLLSTSRPASPLRPGPVRKRSTALLQAARSRISSRTDSSTI